ncbi:MAG: radical SAM protein [Candidatus Heimdallarchaeaceae archaeon]
MNRISKWHDNLVVGTPSEGCRLCSLGSKMVLFITGECDSNCFYCPIMKEKRNDIIYANEQQIETIDQAIKEAHMISALGVGITGGDPSLTLDRVVDYIISLKKEFGVEFHCHLYTSHALTKEQLKQLFSAGLDEIRFHPPSLILTDKIQQAIINAKDYEWKVGIEIPIIPDKQDRIIRIIDFAIESNLDFVNLNEFEITEANVEKLNSLGYKVKTEISAAVEGSESLAKELLKKFKKSPITIHYCSARYKDGVQLKNRLLRRSENYAKEFDEITTEGLVVRGRIILKENDIIPKIISDLQTTFKVESDKTGVDLDNNTIFVHWITAKEITKFLTEKYENQIISIEIIHQYPYQNGIITYLEPLYES